MVQSSNETRVSPLFPLERLCMTGLVIEASPCRYLSQSRFILVTSSNPLIGRPLIEWLQLILVKRVTGNHPIYLMSLFVYVVEDQELIL